MGVNNKSVLDQLIIGFDQTLRHLSGVKRRPQRPLPSQVTCDQVTGKTSDRIVDQTTTSPKLDRNKKILSARLMRVNHSGEIAAQALYRGQAAATNNEDVKKAMRDAATEEADHLAWCETRLQELGGKTSLLNPLWYLGSFSIGYLAGKAGDDWSLGFVGETERQVEAHLQRHLARLPLEDHRSRQIVAAMREDEIRHGQAAMDAGGKILPKPIQKLMGLTSKIMTKSSFWL